MYHPNEILSVPTILSSLALLLCGTLALALVSLLPAWGWVFAFGGSGAIIGALYFLQLEIRIYLLAARQYNDEE